MTPEQHKTIGMAAHPSVIVRDLEIMKRKEPPLRQILLPFQEFVRAEASGGIVLLLCAAMALVWANSPWGNHYVSLWQTKLTIGLGNVVLDKSLLMWINEGLMALFFLVVGLEIKREILVGELSSRKQAVLPVAAALGGMLAPGMLYFAINAGQSGAAGWGIPMATDIAFTLGIMSLLSDRVPLALKVFLTALAIVDDIGAVLVITVFYTHEQLSGLNLGIGGGFFLLLIAANRAGIRHPLIYGLVGIGLWLALLQSGIHATIAGVLVAVAIPAYTWVDPEQFLRKSRAMLDRFKAANASTGSSLISEEHQAALQSLEAACVSVEAPLLRWERALHPWVTFAIMPLFALANAGVLLSSNLAATLTHPSALGVMAGLVIGKPLGITLFTWLATRIGIASLPRGVHWRQILGASCLAGIGFTMSLFIAGLAFTEDELLSAAKVGIFAASLISGVLGWSVLRRTNASNDLTARPH